MAGEMTQPLLSIGAESQPGSGDDEKEHMAEGVEEGKGRGPALTSSTNLKTMSLSRLLSRKKKPEILGEEVPVPPDSAREPRKPGRIQSFRRRVKSVLVGQQIDLTEPVESIETHASFPQAINPGFYTEDRKENAATKDMADNIAADNGENGQLKKVNDAAQCEDRATISRRRRFFERLLGRAKSTVVGVTVQNGELELEEEETYSPDAADSDAKDIGKRSANFYAGSAPGPLPKTRSLTMPKFLSRKRVVENKPATEATSFSSKNAQHKPGGFMPRKKVVEKKHVSDTTSFSNSEAQTKPGRLKSLRTRVRSALGMSHFESERMWGHDPEDFSPVAGVGSSQANAFHNGEGSEAHNKSEAMGYQDSIIHAH